MSIILPFKKMEVVACSFLNSGQPLKLYITMISLMYILALSQIVSLCHVKKPVHKRSIVKFSSNIQTALLQNKHPSP